MGNKEKEKKSAMYARIPEDLHKKLKHMCVESGASFVSLITALLREAIAARKENRTKNT